MTLSIYNFKLYYPEHGESSSNDGASDSDKAVLAGQKKELLKRLKKRRSDSDTDYEIIVDEDYIDPDRPDEEVKEPIIDPEKPGPQKPVIDDREEEEEKKKDIKSKLVRSLFPRVKDTYKFEKIIKAFTTNKQKSVLDSDGERRQIIVKGTPGSIFSVTIQDSDGCNMLKKEIKNKKMPSSGTFVFLQDFPSIRATGEAFKSKEIYSFKLIVAADVLKRGYDTDDFTLEQLADPVLTITKTTSQTGPALGVSGSDITFTGKANSSGGYGGYGGSSQPTKVYSLTITKNPSDSGGRLYVKSLDFTNNITTNSIIKKVVDCSGDTKPILKNKIELKPLTSKSQINTEGITTIANDLEVGMKFTGKTQFIKTVVANLDKDQKVIDYKCNNTLPVRHRLDTTKGLDLGMKVEGNVLDGTIIKSIDCNTSITLSPPQIIKKGTKLVFKRNVSGFVNKVETNANNRGNAIVVLNKSIIVQDRLVLSFDDNKSSLRGYIHCDESGVDTINLKAFITPNSFGDKNITYTLDLDEIITSKPNATDISKTIKRNTATVINMIAGDPDSNAASKTGSITGKPSNGTISSYNSSTDSFTYTPNKGFTGEDQFKFTMSDGTNSSDEKTAFITIK